MAKRLRGRRRIVRGERARPEITPFSGGTRVAAQAGKITRIAALAAASISIGCVSAQPPRPAAPQAHAPQERHVYRVDFVVAANEPGKAPTTSAYTLNLEEWDNGELHLGANVPLGANTSNAPAPRQDVGLKIKASLHAIGDDIVLRDIVEMSNTDDTTPQTPATIHKISTQGDAVMRAGQSALVASLEDPITHKRYQVSATATRLR